VSTGTVMGQESRTPAKNVAVIDRIAGIGGLCFAAVLLADNIIRARAPGFDAAPAQVTAYFLDNRVAAIVPLGLFPVGLLALLPFTAGVWTRARQEESLWWASTGALGAAAIVALFGVVNITEIVLTAKAAQLAASPAIIQALWTLRAAAFGLDMGAIAVTLIGLSRAAASLSLIPAWLAVAALPGAACLTIASIFTVALADGGLWLAVGVAGFIVWLLFVAAASISLLRSRQIPFRPANPD
jgi:hypothetical protein